MVGEVEGRLEKEGRWSLGLDSPCLKSLGPQTWQKPGGPSSSMMVV